MDDLTRRKAENNSKFKLGNDLLEERLSAVAEMDTSVERKLTNWQQTL